MGKNVNNCIHDDLEDLQIEGDSEGLKESGVCSGCGAKVTRKYKLVSETVDGPDGTTEECF